MTISQETVNALLEKTNWYALYISPEKLAPSEYGKVRELEDLAVDLICEYANLYWRRKRNLWEHKYIEVVALDDENLNYVAEYELAADASEENLIRDIAQLVKSVENDEYENHFTSGSVNIKLLATGFHAYRPLLCAKSTESVRITPAPLNEEECKFVEYLKIVVERRENIVCLQGKEVHLMRNLSRGKGVSFFDDYSFYPDFVLWVGDSKRQDILFIDPKGLARFDHKVNSKVDLHIKIKDTEQKIREKNPDLRLHAYIWSHTNPQVIGTDTKMSEDEFRERGVFFSARQDPELVKLLQHALAPSPRKPKSAGNTTTA